MAEELVEYGVEPDRAADVARTLLANVDDPERDVRTVTGGFRAPQAAWDAVMKTLGSDAVEAADEDQAPVDEKSKRRAPRKAAASTNDS